MELVERSMSLVVLVVLGLMVNQLPAAEASRIPGKACDRQCTKILLPVCGTDGDTYNNGCELDIAACKHPDADIKVQYDGRCGSDVSSCVEGSLWKDDCNTCWCGNGRAYCTEKACLPIVPIQRDACDRQCTKILLPVCGTDGDTYNNDCELDIAACQHPEADIKVQHEGRCGEANSLPVGFPYFRTEPKTTAVEIDHTALLVCDARGNPNPTITWYKDNQPVDINNPRYTVLRSGSLQISTSTEEDGGKYECVAENSAGTAFSTLVSLYVRVRRVPPRFSKAPDPVYEVMPGENLNISCVAVGSPMPYVQWKKGPAEDITDSLIAKNVLVLVDIQQSANYTCQAQSTIGLVTQDVQVKVQVSRCIEGDTKPADDGCNTCTCIGGRYGCTEIGCLDQASDATFRGIAAAAGSSVRSDGRCGPKFLAPDGRMVECNQNNNGNCCTRSGYCGGWNCNPEWN